MLPMVESLAMGVLGTAELLFGELLGVWTGIPPAHAKAVKAVISLHVWLLVAQPQVLEVTSVDADPRRSRSHFR